MNISLSDLMDYTDWERQKWHEWLRKQDEQVLKISLGTNGDGRFERIGDWIRHIFSAEKRYVDRLSERPLTDTASIPADNVEALFAFGRESRNALRQLLQTASEPYWNAPQQFKLMSSVITATPKKIVTHVLIHEMRHWAQIATLFRLNGLKHNELHDFLVSPAMGGEWRREQ
jgi:uncharacterized damage-inducible protein DinB